MHTLSGPGVHALSALLTRANAPSWGRALALAGV